MKNLTQSGTVERERALHCEFLVAELQQWHQVQGYSPRTIQAAKQRLNPFWKFLQGRDLIQDGMVDLDSMTTAVLADYQTYLFDYPNARTGEKITAYSQSNFLQGVQVFFQFLHKSGRMTHDPSRVIKLPRATVSIPSAILTPKEMRRLLAMPNTRTVLGFRDRCMLEVLWSTGLRMNELLTLNVNDIQFDEGLLLINRGKGNKPRYIPIGASALAWLRRYLDEVRPLLTREALPKRRWRPSVVSRRLFLSQTAQAIEHSSFGHRLRIYQRKAQIRKRITGHVFRHTLATEMLRNGADLRHIQEMLGHERLTTTQRYLRVVKEELKKVHRHSHPREKTPASQVRYHGTNADS